MKLLSKKILQILKLALLSNLLIGGLSAKVVSSDRFILKILDQTISVQDVRFQLRNLEALNCVYEDSFVVQYFGASFISQLNDFAKGMPEGDEMARSYLHQKVELLKRIRFFFKMLQYSKDQKSVVSTKLKDLIRESTKENKCHQDVLYKDTLKSNFIELMEMEIYLRSRYGSQLKTHQFDSIRPSIELFIESLDKQFTHEYYW
jgi:hypothetical protein